MCLSEPKMQPERAKKPPWSGIGKTGGRLLSLILAAYFISRVASAVDKLYQEKIGMSVTTHYESSRLMPSISICFRNNKEHGEYTGKEINRRLNSTRQIKMYKIILLFHLLSSQ